MRRWQEKSLLQVRDFMGRDFVCSRILQNGHVSIPNRDTVFHLGDQLFVVCAEDDAEAIIAFIGPEKLKWIGKSRILRWYPAVF